MPNPLQYRDALAGARRLRRRSTDAERALWRALRSRQLIGTKFRRQHPIGGYVLDFYCETARLGVELDGGQHADPEMKRRDEQRARELKKRGIRVIRFWDNDVLTKTEAVLQRIAEAIASPSPLPSPGGRGKDSQRGRETP